MLLLLAGCGAKSPPPDLTDGAYVVLVNASADDEHLWENAFCGGVLVAPDLVATATHCLGDDNLPDVVVGSRNLCEAAEPITRVAAVGRIDGSGSAAELSLVQLEDDVATAYPAIGDELSAGDIAVAVGWGRHAADTARPCLAKSIGLVAASAELCVPMVRRAREEDIAPGAVTCMVPASELNTCVGDSGGGVFSRRGDETRLVGVTLGGAGCDAQDPGVYASPAAIRALLAH